MKKIMWLLLSLCTLFAYASEEPVSLKVDNFEIHGTLRIPESDSTVPVVLIIAGSGPTDRDGNNPGMVNNSNKMLAEGLNENGIATLNYDKRGIAASAVPDQREEDLNFEDLIDDVIRWIDWLDKDPRFSRIIILGHSEGSLIGMCAAVDNPKIDAFISLAGVAVPADEILKKQLGEQSPLLLEIVTPMIDQLKRERLLDEEIDPQLMSLFRPSVQPYLISWFKYNPSAIIRELTIPVLIINGTTDIQVGIEQAELLKEAKPDAELILIENMNHVLKDAEEANRLAQLPVYMNPDLPLSAALVPSIVDWLKR